MSNNKQIIFHDQNSHCRLSMPGAPALREWAKRMLRGLASIALYVPPAQREREEADKKQEQARRERKERRRSQRRRCVE